MEQENFAYASSYLRHKEMRQRVRFFTRSAFACILLSVVVISSVIYFAMPGKPSADAATFTFVQSAWDAVADAVSLPGHPEDRTGWTKYFAKDENVSTGSEISMSGPVGSWVQTSDTDFNAAGSVFDGTAVSGSGSDASLLPGGSYVGPDANAYLYRRAVAVQHNVAAAYTGYQVRIDLDTAALISAGKMQSDCRDLRFSEADIDHANIPYWIESGCNTGATIIWAKTNLAASAFKNIFMYYGNSAVASASDGSGTFDFFDDFIGSAIDATKWNSVTATAGTLTVNGGIMTATAPGANGSYAMLTGKATFAGNTAVRARVKSAHATNKYNEKMNFYGSVGGGGLTAHYSLVYPTPLSYTSVKPTNNESSSPIIGWAADTYGVQDIIRNATSSGIFRLNDGNQVTITSNIYTGTDCTVQFYTGTNNGSLVGSSLSADWVLVRKYAATEPTVSVGTENEISNLSPGLYYSSVHFSGSGSVFGNLTFSGNDNPSFPAALSDWSYRKKFTVQNNVATNYAAGYQVQMTVDTSSLIAAGRMQGDCSDMRFAEMDGTIIPYWIESGCDTAATRVWIKSNLTANAAKGIYMYYGNAAAGLAASSGTSVFLKYSDANDAASWAGTAMAKDGNELRANYAALTYSTLPVSLPLPWVIETKIRFVAGSSPNMILSIGNGTSSALGANRNVYAYLHSGADYGGSLNTGSTYTVAATTVGGATHIHKWAGITTSKYDHYLYDDSRNLLGSVLGTTYAYSMPPSTVTGFQVGSPGGSVYVSWMFARRYAATEPTVTASGPVIFQFRSADTPEALASAVWYGPTGTSDYYIASGTAINPVHNGNKYIQYRTFLTDADAALTDVTVAIDSVQTLVSSPYDIGDVTAVLSDLRWTQTTPDGDPNGNEVRFQLRAAPDAAGAPGEWSGWVGPDGTAGTYYANPAGGSAIPSILKTDVQWMQYKLFLKSVTVSPTVDDITLQYTLNAQPQVSVTGAAQGSNGVVTVDYTVSDSDVGDPHTAYVSAYVGTNLNEDLTAVDLTAVTVTDGDSFPGSGTILIDDEMIAYTGKLGNDLTGLTRYANGSTVAAHTTGAEIYILGTHATGIGLIAEVTSDPSAKTIAWTINADVPGIYLVNTAKIKVSVNDGNGAFQFGSGASTALDMLDTKAPVMTSVIVNGVLAANNITMNVDDDDPDFVVKYSIRQADLDDPAGYVAYTSAVAAANIDLENQNVVYFRFKDWKGNVTDYTDTLPAQAQTPLLQDVSNATTEQYRLFFSFSPVANPAGGFSAYHIYASDSAAGTYTEIADTDLNTAALNYFMDIGLTANQLKYYRVAASDLLGNYALLSVPVSGTANGYEDPDEGNGGGEEEEPVLPVITHDASSQITAVTDTGATISFTTDQNSDSSIRFSTDTGYGKEQGVPTFITAGNAHTVTLMGLTDNTTYYYKIVAMDASGNLGMLENSATQHFTTTTDTVAPLISSVAEAPADTTAVVIFKTDEAARVRIDYGTGTGYGQSVTDPDFNIDHRLVLTGLNADTAYHYKVTVTDGSVSENASDSGDRTFTTVTLPVITFNSVTGITDITATRATITFATNINTDSLIDYSKAESVFTSTQGSYRDNVTAHAVTLTGLDPETRYYFQVRASDTGGHETRVNDTTGYTFTTLPSQDKNAPAISAVAIATPASTNVTVTWTTDEPSSSLVDFGTTINFGKTQGNAGELVTDHSVTLTGLSSATAYLLRVKSTDENGNLRTDDNDSSGYPFTTAAPAAGTEDVTPPVIVFDADAGITNVTPNSVAIAWTTDEDADSTVGYGLNTNFAQEQGASTLTGNHAVVLTNLSPGTAYRFQLRSQDASGNAVTDDNGGLGYAFTTLSGSDKISPAIGDVQAGSLTGDGVTITWTTDESASSLIEYGTAAGSFTNTAGNYTEMVSDHSVTIGGLTALTAYYFRVRSEDPSKNMATDNGGAIPYTFTTLTEETVCPACSGGGSSRDSTAPKISGLKISGIASASAIVTWTTNEGGYSLVEYGKDDAYGNVFGSGIDCEKEHSVRLIGLSPDTAYSFRALSADASGNLAQSEKNTFTTAKVGELPAEEQYTLKEQTEQKIKELVESGMSEEEIRQVIAGSSTPFSITSESPKVSDITNNSARIGWMTDKDANSVVRFKTKGGDDAFIKEFGNFNELEMDHDAILSNLDSGIAYEFQVQSSDVLGNTSRSDWYVFTTSITPSIYDVTVSNVNLSSATVEWKTNVASSGELEYGLDINYDGKVKGMTSEKSVTHIMKLNNLMSGRTYHYRIKGIDLGGNILSSDDYTLTTYTLPEIENYSIASVAEREAIIRWISNIETDSTIRYTDSLTGEVKTQGEDALTRSHDFSLKGLEPGKEYVIQIQGRDSYGNQAVSGEFGLTTPADTTAPEFGRVNVETAVSSGKSAQVRTIISYITTEPGTTQVFYEQGTGGGEYAASTPLDENLTTNHTVIITDFRPATVYKFKLETEDASGNVASSKDFTVLVPEEERSVIQMITQNFENTFGWLKNINR